MNDVMEENEENAESLVKYTQRKGTNNSGMDYEIKMLALIALRCVSQDFENVWLGTNVDKVGDFDDIILQVKKPSEHSRYTFMMQLKHAEKPKHITKQEFMPDVNKALEKSANKKPKGDFCLPKYAEGFSELISEVQSSLADGVVKYIEIPTTKFLLFTNRSTNPSCSFLENCPVDSIDFLNTSKTASNLYRFNCDVLGGAESLKNIHCCRNICLFSKQMGVNEVDNLIKTEVTKVLNHFGLSNNNCSNEVIAREFRQFIEDWRNTKSGCPFYLTKQCILNKMSELLLCQYAAKFLIGPMIFYDSDREALWSKIVTDKFITIIDHSETTSKFLTRYIGSEMKHYIKSSANWSDVLSSEEQSEVHGDIKLKTTILRSVGKHKSITILDFYKCLWLNGSLPLLLEISEIEEYQDIIKVLEASLHQFKIIIINKSKVAISDASFRVPYFLTLSDLNEQDRTNILNLSIKLQGKSYPSLQNLIGTSMNTFIKANDVINILTGDFNIGNEYPEHLHLENNFISRSLSKIIFKHDVVNQLKDEKFVIECPFNITSDMPTDMFNFPHENAIICNEKDSSKEMNNLKNNGKVIHRLRFYSREYFEWKETFGSIKNICSHQFIQERGLYQYIIVNPIISISMSLNNIDHFWIPIANILENSSPHLLNKLNIINAGPGMGKTTLLDFIAHSSKLWTIKIYLSDYREYFEELRNTTQELTAPYHLQRLNELLFRRYNYFNTTLSQKVFQKLLDRKMVLILIDGFDEISISYKDEVTQMIKGFLMQGCPIWITTRSVMKSYLEETFNTISVTLKPFNKDDQKKFLLGYFQECIKNTSSNPLIQEFVNQLLNAARINLNSDDEEFSGFPLQIKLLAEVFSDKFKECLHSKVIKFDNRFDLLYLYKEFFNKKHEIFYKKHGTAVREFHRIFQDHQQLFALKILFPKEDLYQLKIDNELKDYYKNKYDKMELLQRDGIIVVEQIRRASNPQFNIRFCHRSFAEYLAAEWLAVNITSDSETKKNTAHNLVKKRFDQNVNVSVNPRGISYYRFLFEVFDRIVSEGCTLHLAIINRHITEAQGIITLNPYSAEEVDKCERTILHTAALYGSYHMPVFTGLPLSDEIVNIIDLIPQSIWKLNKDILGYDPLYYAIASNTLAIADKICERSKGSLNIQNVLDISSKAMYTTYCISLRYKSLFKLLIRHFAIRDLLQLDVIKDMSVKDYCHHCHLYRLNFTDPDFITEYGNQTVWNLCSSVVSPPDKYYTELGLATAFGSVKNVRNLLKKHSNLINFQDSNKNTALHYAVIHARLDLLKDLLNHRADINNAGCNNNTPLHFAVRSGRKELVERLLLKRPHLNKLNGNENTPLFMAASGGNIDILNLLLTKGADCNVGSDIHGNSALHYCCANGRDDIVETLLLKGANVNTLNGFGETPLHVAVRNGNTKIAELLLYYKANAWIVDRNGASPLHHAILSGNTDVIDLLLKEREQHLNETSECTQPTATKNIYATPMHVAVTNRRVDIAKRLLLHGESCNAIDINQRTPLHYAAERGFDDIVDLLLSSNNANVDIQDVNGETAFHLASRRGHLAIANVLFSKTKTNAKDAAGNSLLHYAAASGNRDVILKLVSEDASINCRNFLEETPLNFAIANAVACSPSTVKLLLSKGAKYNIFDVYGYSPIHNAARFGKIELLPLLMQNPSDANLLNARNQTPLHISMPSDMMFTEQGLAIQKEVVLFLLDKGANLNICDNNANTVLHYASMYITRSCYTFGSEEIKKCLHNFHRDVVQLLISRGADKNLKNKEGYTAASLAAKYGCTELVDLL